MPINCTKDTGVGTMKRKSGMVRMGLYLPFSGEENQDNLEEERVDCFGDHQTDD